MMALQFFHRPPRKWEVRYFRLAHFWADQCSKDPTTKVGAVLVGKDRRHIALGYNGFPPGVADDPERYADRQTKYVFTQHAERNVLDNAAFSCADATLVSTHFPCAECTKSLISKGVKTLVTTMPPNPIAEPSWRDLLPHAVTMLQEAGVQIAIVQSQDLEE